jgi:hypothetical protein
MNGSTVLLRKCDSDCTRHSGVTVHWHRCDNAVTCSAVSMTPLCKYDTAVTLDLIFERLWLPVKGISIKKTYLGKLPYTISLNFTHKYENLLRSVFCYSVIIDTAVTKITISKSIYFANSKPCIRGLGWVVWWKKPEAENLLPGSLCTVYGFEFAKKIDFKIADFGHSIKTGVHVTAVSMTSLWNAHCTLVSLRQLWYAQFLGAR